MEAKTQRKVGMGWDKGLIAEEEWGGGVGGGGGDGGGVGGGEVLEMLRLNLLYQLLNVQQH